MYRLSTSLFSKLPAHKLAQLALSIWLLTLLLIGLVISVFIYDIMQHNLRDNAKHAVEQWAVQLSTIDPQLHKSSKQILEQFAPPILDDRQHHFVVERLQGNVATKSFSKKILNHSGIHADTLLNLPEWAYMYAHKQGSTQYYLGMQHYFVIYKTLPTLNWTIGLAVPYCSILDTMQFYILSLLLLIGFLVFLSFLLQTYQRCCCFEKMNTALKTIHQIAQPQKKIKPIENCMQFEENTDILLIQTQQTVQHLLKERNHLKAMLAAMKIGVLFEDENHHIIYHNSSFKRIWSLPQNIKLIGKNIQNIIELTKKVLPKNVACNLLRHEQQSSDLKNTEYHNMEFKVDDKHIVTQQCFPVYTHQDAYLGQLWLYDDVTKIRHIESQVSYLSLHDPLTGLLNRHALLMELKRLVSHKQRHGTEHALFILNLDKFKLINQQYGCGIGDSVLKRCASELKKIVRDDEFLARMGSDEFAILTHNIDLEHIEVPVQRLLSAISSIPFESGKHTFFLTASLGIASLPHHAQDVEGLLAHAGSAIYQAKNAGKNTWKFYDPDYNCVEKSTEQLLWNKRIKHALEHGLMQFHFQGIFHASDHSLAHLEVLLRMQDISNPNRLIMPGTFIPIAEKSNLITEIDRFVVNAGITLLARSDRIPPLAVNISGRSLGDPDFAYYIARQVELAGISPNRLLIELTETAAISDLHEAQHFIDVLIHAGCRVCLDDFGVGFSSFAYLKHLKADVIKIDGMFIRDLLTDKYNQIIVKAIVDVARSMGKTTVAEFVEDKATLDMLHAFGVDWIQGYYFDKPCANPSVFQGVPVEDLRFLRQAD